MPVGDSQELAEVSLWFWPASDPEEIDDLDEQAGPSAAGSAHRAHQLGEARDESIVPDPEQWPARYVADSGSLYHQRARLAAREALVPRQHRSEEHTSELQSRRDL